MWDTPITLSTAELQLVLLRCCCGGPTLMGGGVGPDSTANLANLQRMFLRSGSSSPRNEQQDNAAFNRLRQTDRLSDRSDRQASSHCSS